MHAETFDVAFNSWSHKAHHQAKATLANMGVNPNSDVDLSFISKLCRDFLSVAQVCAITKSHDTESNAYDFYDYWRFKLQTETEFSVPIRCSPGAPLPSALMTEWINAEHAKRNAESESSSIVDNTVTLARLSSIFSLSFLHYFRMLQDSYLGDITDHAGLHTDLCAVVDDQLETVGNVKMYPHDLADWLAADRVSDVSWSFNVAENGHDIYGGLFHKVPEISLGRTHVDRLVATSSCEPIQLKPAA